MSALGRGVLPAGDLRAGGQVEARSGEILGGADSQQQEVGTGRRRYTQIMPEDYS